jgi:hypothetical protein
VSGPNAEVAPLYIRAPLTAWRWPLRFRLDDAGMRVVCGWSTCEAALIELSPIEAEDFPLDAGTLAELADDHAPECKHAGCQRH